MAIEKEIPKDIRQYETKLIGPFTARQIFSLAPAIGLGLTAYFGLENYLIVDIRLFIVTLIAVPFILIGWYKPYGLPFEKFVKTAFISLVVAPPFRKYKTARIDDGCFEKNTHSKTKHSKRKRSKKQTDPLLQPHR